MEAAMSRQVTKTIYTFDELSDEAKERAINDWNAEGLDYQWWDFVYNDAKEIGKLMGIQIENIYFSGFWSQGDGACFEGYYAHEKGSVKAVKGYAPQDRELHRIARDLSKVQRPYFYGLEASVRHQGRYSHEFCTVINVEDRRDYPADDISAGQEGIAEVLRDLMRWIYRTLEKEYEYQTSEENVSELLRINEYEFTAAGKMVFCEQAGKSLQANGG